MLGERDQDEAGRACTCKPPALPPWPPRDATPAMSPPSPRPSLIPYPPPWPPRDATPAASPPPGTAAPQSRGSRADEVAPTQQQLPTLPLSLLPGALLLVILRDRVQQAGGLVRIEVGPEQVAAPKQSMHEPIHDSGSSRIQAQVWGSGIQETGSPPKSRRRISFPGIRLPAPREESGELGQRPCSIGHLSGPAAGQVLLHQAAKLRDQ